ncbi:hypothetical protein [Hyperthermus butylicus]|uniref:Uncharacterized protein n=1 Tax=Hyperthermus butylicus (strain DSM 5456 / JCM 9403 / PLM1-5) TaxID=415426 RepID=A2BLT0_HYPBU|nr:hypothetical protein [Hyperthermus butylicus]ABM80941.1 hypothetical protein Hbut_1098 [Hyperthermus butylicus DSM 5456]
MKNTLLVAVVAAAILYSFSVMAAAEEVPVIHIVDSRPVVMLEAFGSNYIVYAVKDGEAYKVYLAYINTTELKPSLTPLYEATMDSEPVYATLDNPSNPRYVFVVSRRGDLLILDLEEPGHYVFAGKGNPKGMAYLNLGRPSIAVLTELDNDYRLYIVSRIRLGWFEAGDAVGSLLGERLENSIVQQVVPVYKPTGSLIEPAGSAIVKLLPTATVSAKAKLRLQILYNGTPIQGVTVFGYIPSTSQFTPESITDENGYAILQLPTLAQLIDIIVSYGGTCYIAVVNTTKAIEVDNTLNYPEPMDITLLNKTVCINPRREYAYYLVSGGYPPRVSELASSYKLMNSTALLAYIFNGKLYLWVTGRDVEFTKLDRIVLVLAVFSPDGAVAYENLWRYYVLGDYARTAAISPDANIVAIGTSSGSLLVAGLDGDTYRLLWSLQLHAAIKHVSIAKTTRGYVVAAVDEGGNIGLVVIDTERGEVRVESESSHCTTCISPWPGTVAAILGPEANFLAVGTGAGLVVVNSFANLLFGHIVTEQLIANYTLRTLSISFVNEDGEPLENLTVAATLYVNNTVVDSISYVEAGPTIEAPCMEPGILEITVAPKEPIYEPSSYKILCAGKSNVTLTVPYKRFTLVLHLVDSYTNKPPIRNLTVQLIDEKRSRTISATYPSGTRSIELSELLPGNYTIVVREVGGGLYREATTRICMDSDRDVIVTLERINVAVIVTLASQYTTPKGDGIRLRVVGDNRVLYEQEFYGIEADRPYLISFQTQHRGSATIEVTPLHPAGEDPFFKPLTRTVNVTDNGAAVEIQLEPVTYRLTLRLTGVVGNETIPVTARVTIDRVEDEKIRSVLVLNATATITLVKGTYRLHIDPLPYDNTGFKIFDVVEREVYLARDNSVLDIRLPTVRMPVTAKILDKLALENRIVDSIVVRLDGVEVARISPGPPQTLTLLVHVNGSVLTIESARNFYQPVNITIKPSNTTLEIALARTPRTLHIVVENDQGKGLAAATVNIAGMDVVFSSTLMTGVDGTVDAVLPSNANYQVCAVAKGYRQACTSILLTTDDTVTLALQPTIQTLLLRYLNVIIMIVISAVILIVIRHYLSKLMMRLAAEEEF